MFIDLYHVGYKRTDSIDDLSFYLSLQYGDDWGQFDFCWRVEQLIELRSPIQFVQQIDENFFRNSNDFEVFYNFPRFPGEEAPSRW